MSESAAKLSAIAVDMMSGDAGVSVTIDAVSRFLQSSPDSDTELVLVGDPQQLAQQINTLSGDMRSRCQACQVVPASEVVDMEDSTRDALRNKKDSSMRVAIDCVKDGRAAACVSSGNTGALLAISKFVLKTLPGIARPAISTTLPGINGHSHMLDLGANVDCTAEHLVQFAVMGSVLSGAVDSVANPSIALLNIGSEDIKGNEQVKETALLLEQIRDRTGLNYVGFVEGDEIYTGNVDVVVCDGFAGNVSLKSSEGVARMISHFMRQEFTAGWPSKLAALIARPVLKSLNRRIDPRRYNGASLLGLQGVVIKSHGSADALAFANAINIARMEIEKNVPERIGENIASLLNTSAPATAEGNRSDSDSTAASARTTAATNSQFD